MQLRHKATPSLRPLLIALTILAAAPASLAQYGANASFNGHSVQMGTGGDQQDNDQVKPEDAARVCQQKMELARKALDEGKLAVAAQNLAMARDMAYDDGMAQAVLQMYVQLNQAGEAKLAEADKLYAAGDFVAATKAYASLSTGLGHIPAGVKAKQKLDQAGKDPAVRATVNEAKAADLYEIYTASLQEAPATQPASAPGTPMPMLAEADVAAHLPVEKQSKLIKDLQSLVKLYPECPSGQRASSLLAQLQSNAAMMQTIAQWEQQDIVRKKFEKAQMYFKARLYEKAGQLYRDVYENYPASPYAEKAREQHAAVQAALSITPH